MKKIIVILLLLIFTLSLTACSSEDWDQLFGQLFDGNSTAPDNGNGGTTNSDNTTNNDNDNTPPPPVEIVLSLNFNGGQVQDGDTYVTSLRGYEGDALELPTPVRDGYEFYGWCNGYTKFTSNTFPSSNTTLTARWIVVKDKEISITNKKTNKYSVDYNSAWIALLTDDNINNMIEYLKENNITSNINLKVTYEAQINASKLVTSMGVHGTLKITGNTQGTVFHTQEIKNKGFEIFTYTKSVSPDQIIPVNNNNYYMHFYIETNNWNYPVDLQNITVVITYIEEAGTLI
ncbi:MAG: InlB B-repeat-containing protein [Clostridia bacterium]|nr:InlB B-repeat-containing protein [Clostridia bacterium]